MPQQSAAAICEPTDARAFARTLRKAGQFDEAVGVLRGALSRAPNAAVHNDLAVVLRELGRLDEAETHFRRAAELAPGFAPYFANLGQTMMMQDRADEAVELFRRAVALAPGHAPFHRVLGGAFEALDRLEEAEASYRAAIRLAPGLALAHHDLGAILVRRGRRGGRDEALGPLERAAALDPNNSVHWENLALEYEQAGRFGQAVEAWERALELEMGGRAHVHLALGRALRVEGRAGEAEARFLAALVVDPDSVEARLELGGICEDRGDFAGAEAAYRDVLAIDPQSSLGHVRLAGLLRGRLPDADLARLEAKLNDLMPEPDARFQLPYVLATVLDARGDRPRAVALLRQANALQREADQSAGRGFNRDGYIGFLDSLVVAFGPAFFDRVAGAGFDTRRPVFVVGLPRSGTTLIEQVLAAHPAVLGAGELYLARNAFEGLPATVGRPGEPHVESVAWLDAPTIGRLAADYLAHLHNLDDGRAARVVDKMPENYLYLGLIAALFPRATIIHCRRDLRDTALSCWMTIFQDLRWTNDPADIAAVFRCYLRLMDHWRTTLPTTIHEVDYEETVTDLEGTARRLVAALGLDWSPSCLEFHRAGRSVRTASALQIREPVHRRSVGRWKLYESELADLFAALACAGT
jgi:tetratricopeptide (TPR) repeat protein